MFEDFFSLFDFDFSSWISEVVGYFTTSHEVSEGIYEDTIANVPWSALIPWQQVFAFVFLVVFVVCIFKFMRSVLCRLF